MLLYVGFPEFERGLLAHAAEKLDVSDRTQYMSNVDALLDAVQNTDASMPATFPDVIFLNVDEIDWRSLLKALKSHTVINRVPVVALGRLSDQDEIDALYDAGANSYIMKPDTFGDMMRAASTSLSYWLDTTQLPSRHLHEL